VDRVFDKHRVKRSRFAPSAAVRWFPVSGHAVRKGSLCCHLACAFLYIVVLSAVNSPLIHMYRDLYNRIRQQKAPVRRHGLLSHVLCLCLLTGFPSCTALITRFGEKQRSFVC